MLDSNSNPYTPKQVVLNLIYSKDYSATYGKNEPNYSVRIYFIVKYGNISKIETVH